MVKVVRMRVVSSNDDEEVMNQEETDEDMADEMTQEVDSRDVVMRSEKSDP